MLKLLFNQSINFFTSAHFSVMLIILLVSYLVMNPIDLIGQWFILNLPIKFLFTILILYRGIELLRYRHATTWVLTMLVITGIWSGVSFFDYFRYENFQSDCSYTQPHNDDLLTCVSSQIFTISTSCFDRLHHMNGIVARSEKEYSLQLDYHLVMDFLPIGLRIQGSHEVDCWNYYLDFNS